MHRFLAAGWLLLCLVPAGARRALAMPSPQATKSVRLAQAQPQTQPAQAPQTPPAPDAAAPDAATDAQQAAEEPIGNVATLIGSATVTRNNETSALKLKDDIFQNDVLQTSAKSSLGITFSDATTFNLTANASITVDSFIYEEGGKQNAALFDVAKGTVAFVAAAVAKTGDMKISTPTATLGIRGTSGLVEVPEGASATSGNNVAIKLYPDADGKVGRIEVNDRAGARLGFLTQGRKRIYDPAGRGRHAVCRGAADDLAAADAARPGLRAPGPLHAEFRPPGRQPATRLASRQPRLQQSEPRQPAASARWSAAPE